MHCVTPCSVSDCTFVTTFIYTSCYCTRYCIVFIFHSVTVLSNVVSQLLVSSYFFIPILHIFHAFICVINHHHHPGPFIPSCVSRSASLFLVSGRMQKQRNSVCLRRRRMGWRCRDLLAYVLRIYGTTKKTRNQLHISRSCSTRISLDPLRVARRLQFNIPVGYFM